MKIVEGETRFSKLGSFASAATTGETVDVKALDLQQLFLAMTEEVCRVPSGARPSKLQLNAGSGRDETLELWRRRRRLPHTST